jgi:hypothetical protein
MGIEKATIHVPSIASQIDDSENERRIVILQNDSYAGLNIEQAAYLRLVLDRWISSQGNRNKWH